MPQSKPVQPSKTSVKTIPIKKVALKQVVTADKPVLKPMTPIETTAPEEVKKTKKGPVFLIGLLVILLGAGSGYAFAGMRNGNNNVGGLKQEKGLKREVESHEITVGTKVGVADESTFRDSTEGELDKGGIDGEGSHHLTRPGGDSQTVYITSSIIDLDQFIGKKVKIWGETLASEKAGWFMDVGKLEILE
jgi:hypothetical protein